MGFFDKLKKNKKPSEASFLDGIDTSDWYEVFSACLGKMMAIQTNANKYAVKDRGWNVVFSEGYIAFEQDKYPIQFIGTESSINNTWMWGWNNINHFSKNILSLATEVQKTGKKWRLDPLRIQQFDLDDEFNGHTLSMVACAISKDDYFYYRGPHSQGAILVAVANAPKEVFSPVDVHTFITLTMQCIAQYSVDHKIFAESFLRWNKTDYHWDNDVLIAHFPTNLHITFEKTHGFYNIEKMNTFPSEQEPSC